MHIFLPGGVDMQEFTFKWEIDGEVYDEMPEKFIDDVVWAIIETLKPLPIPKAE